MKALTPIALLIIGCVITIVMIKKEVGLVGSLLVALAFAIVAAVCLAII